MFRLESPQILYFYLILPLLIGIYLLAFSKYRKNMERFIGSKLLGTLVPYQSVGRKHLKFGIFLLSISSLIFALARPQFGSRLEEAKREGIEIIIALDVSNSMNARDIQPSRLERSRQAINTMLNNLEEDQIGMIVFAGDAYTQVPITSDYISAKMFLKSINTEMVSRQGTAIGKAIELAMKSFTPSEESSKVIIVISDGENHEGNAVEMVKLAAEKGIKTYTIGMGSKQGAVIPSLTGGFVKDGSGQVVTSKMNAEMLNELAMAGEGKYFHVSASNFGLNKLVDDLKKLEKGEIETKVYSEYKDQYHYFVAFALFLLLVDFLILERKNKYLKDVELFGSNK